MNIYNKLLVTMFLSLPLLCLAEGVEIPRIICPLKPDPPPLIDANPKEWQTLPGLVEITGEHARYGKVKWKNEEDLSGSVQFCWDENYLYVLAQVTDDKIIVTKSGKNLFMTDHIELDIDPFWTSGGNGDFTKQQFVIGISPGNMEKSGDPMLDREPEFYIYNPDGITPPGDLDIASTHTETGYLIETRIPWKLLGVKPEQKKIIGLDIHFSDSDNVEDQEKMTSLYPGDWTGRKREKMVPVMLTDTQGK